MVSIKHINFFCVYKTSREKDLLVLYVKYKKKIEMDRQDFQPWSTLVKR